MAGCQVSVAGRPALYTLLVCTLCANPVTRACHKTARAVTAALTGLLGLSLFTDVCFLQQHCCRQPVGLVPFLTLCMWLSTSHMVVLRKCQRCRGTLWAISLSLFGCHEVTTNKPQCGKACMIVLDHRRCRQSHTWDYYSLLIFVSLLGVF